jgi:hypothetical protein
LRDDEAGIAQSPIGRIGHEPVDGSFDSRGRGDWQVSLGISGISASEGVEAYFGGGPGRFRLYVTVPEISMVDNPSSQDRF